MERVDEKKIAIVIAFRNFRDTEYYFPRKALENITSNIIIVSTSTGTALGVNGGEVSVDVLLKDLEVENFDAVVFIGGEGCLKYLDNQGSYRLIQEVVSKNKLLGAICISPVILAKAGVLNGKNATVWSNILNKSPIKILEENGATYKDELVVVDEKIVTANGPAAAKEFGESLVGVLTSK